MKVIASRISGMLLVLFTSFVPAVVSGAVNDWADIPSEALRSNGMARVLVLFQDPVVEDLRRISAASPPPAPNDDKASRQRAARAIAEADATLSAAVSAATNAILADLTPGTCAVDRRYRFSPLVALTITPQALDKLLADERVVSIVANVPTPLPDEEEGESFESGTSASADGATIDPPLLADSVDIVGAPGAWGKGYAGAGWHVAVLDTGIRVSHNFFAGKDIVEACFSYEGDCPNNETTMTGPGSAAHYVYGSWVFDHGTHVAGIAAGHLVDDSMNGVARDADIIAVNVFSFIESWGDVGSYFSDQIAGLEYVYGLRGTYSIAAVNMSLGSGRYSSPCDVGEIRTPIIEKLYSVGVPTVISAGNDRYCGAISTPACISTAVAVSAVDDNDDEYAFNNWSEDMTDIWAPGVGVVSSLGSSDTAFGSKTGTSMAAPHVTGAFAIQRQHAPTDPIEKLFARMTQLGPQLMSTRCSSTKVRPRLYVDHFDLISGLRTTLTPEDARTDGAQWRVDGGAWLDSATLVAVDPGRYEVDFKSVSGWVAPASQTVEVVDEAISDVAGVYSRDTSLLGEALDNADLVWTTGGDSQWFHQRTQSTYGGDAAQSGDVSNYQSNWLETTVKGPGTLSYFWKVSSERYYDYLSFLLDGQEIDAITGEVDWSRQSHVLSAGTRTLRWTYGKDSSGESGEDAGWVDRVIWTPGPNILGFMPSILSATKSHE